MRENRLSGSEGGAALVVPTPIFRFGPCGTSPLQAVFSAPYVDAQGLWSG
jgi:hypothetical protein